MAKIKYILITFCFTISFTKIIAQPTPPLSVGMGVNTTIYFSSLYYSVPSLPITPYINLKIKKHELLAGVDLYPFPLENGHVIIGGQAGYRYHFLRENKPWHVFADCNLQYVAFQSGCGGPQPYNSNDPKNFCFDGAIYQDKSFINTYGIGAELNFLKRFSFYTILGAGFNYYEHKIYKDWSGYGLKDDYSIFFVGNIRVGLSFNVYQNKK